MLPKTQFVLWEVALPKEGSHLLSAEDCTLEEVDDDDGITYKWIYMYVRKTI